MIKLFSLKQEKEASAAAAAKGEGKIAPGQIRMQKGVRKATAANSLLPPHPRNLTPLDPPPLAP